MIPQIEPWIDQADVDAVASAVRSTWVTEHERTRVFEKRIAGLTGAKHAIAFFNGTVALYSALRILGIGPGDEVIVPDFTFIASANSVIMAGAKPVLVDIDKRTFNIDPKKAEERITKRTRAIMPVHIYGQCADMDAIMGVARKNSLKVIEDAAQAIGSSFDGRHAGTFGDFGMISFYGNKTITTGEGGVLLTDSDQLAREANMFKTHGRRVKGTFIHDKLGFNFSFTEMQAALGNSQLDKLDKIIKRKAEIRNKYIELLKDVPDIEFTYTDPRCTPVHWFTSILVKDPEALADFLRERGIGTRRFFYPVHRQPCYSINEDFPNSEWAYQHGISLPSSYSLGDDQISHVSKNIIEYYERKD